MKGNKRLLALLVLLLASGCARLPGLGGASGDEGIARLLENRVWLDEDAPVPGSLRAWLGEGEMLFASCWEVPRLGAWRWIGTAELEWRDAAEVTRAEVAMIGDDELVLVVDAGGVPLTRRFRAAAGAPPC
jgi:hypothetical protein